VGVAEILAEIDREIEQLQRARTLLKNGSNGANGNGAKSPHAGKKRNLTAEGRKRISEAVRRRWAKQRKAATGN
jgi:adenylosuccinate lyase